LEEVGKEDHMYSSHHTLQNHTCKLLEEYDMIYANSSNIDRFDLFVHIYYYKILVGAEEVVDMDYYK
jgi:hypothetical protein